MIDLHAHTDRSDGSTDPGEVARMAVHEGHRNAWNFEPRYARGVYVIAAQIDGSAMLELAQNLTAAWLVTICARGGPPQSSRTASSAGADRSSTFRRRGCFAFQQPGRGSQEDFGDFEPAAHFAVGSLR